MDEICAALKTFPPGSSGGPLLLMPAHIPRSSHPDARVCKLPSETRELLCSARLFPLSKPAGGVRPIAVGEVLRRLAAKVLTARYQANVVARLAPLQVGVGLPGAAEALAHRVRQWSATATSGSALMTLDFRNAFNSLDRTAMLRAIARYCPEFVPHATFCYGPAILGPCPHRFLLRVSTG